MAVLEKTLEENMKKIIIFLFIAFICTGLFATITPEIVIEKIKSSDLWCFDIEQAEKEKKPYIKLTYEGATDFTRKTRICLNWDLYPNQSRMTFDELKAIFKSCNNLMFGYSYSSFADYTWKEGNQLSYSIQYTQIKNGPIEGAGSYVIRIFFDESVLTILLQDKTDYIEQKKEYEVLNELCFYKDGNLLDKNKGIERTKGYYWRNEASLKTFYDMLKNKDSSLPKEAIKFQNSTDKIFNILDNYR